VDDWALVLFDRMVHPLQVGIMEAFDWMGEPLSPSLFVALNRRHCFDVRTVSYHFRALEEYGLLELVEIRRVRGAHEVMYAPTE
jgi:hypothetical protein